MSLNFNGIILGSVMLISTGLGHIIVIKGEYHLSTKIWPIFLFIGVLCLCLSVSVKNSLLSGILGILGVTSLWAILELFQQKEST